MNQQQQTISNQCRQGDVLLQRVDPALISKKHRSVGRDKDGALTLQRGDVTGHRHRFHDKGVRLLRSDDGNAPVILEVPRKSKLVHDEHSTIAVAKGTYLVVIQEELLDGAFQQVLD